MLSSAPNAASMPSLHWCSTCVSSAQPRTDACACQMLGVQGVHPATYMAARELMISGSRPENDSTSETSPLGVCTSPRACADLLPACSFCTTPTRTESTTGSITARGTPLCKPLQVCHVEMSYQVAEIQAAVLFGGLDELLWSTRLPSSELGAAPHLPSLLLQPCEQALCVTLTRPGCRRGISRALGQVEVQHPYRQGYSYNQSGPLAFVFSSICSPSPFSARGCTRTTLLRVDARTGERVLPAKLALRADIANAMLGWL